MLLKTQGIVLQNFKYNDAKHIIKIFTQDKGLLTFIVHVSSGTKSKFKPAFFQTFTLLSIDYQFKDNKSFLSIKEVKCYHPYKTIHVDFLKTTVALFCTELLLKCLVNEDCNYELYDFIECFAKHLDASDAAITHLPNWYALHLTKFLGFFPLMASDGAIGNFFNMIDGVFQDDAPMHVHYVTGDILMSFMALISVSLDQVYLFQIPKVYRTEIQKILLEYYQLHNYPVQNMQSLDVFRKVLSD